MHDAVLLQIITPFRAGLWFDCHRVAAESLNSPPSLGQHKGEISLISRPPPLSLPYGVEMQRIVQEVGLGFVNICSHFWVLLMEHNRIENKMQPTIL